MAAFFRAVLTSICIVTALSACSPGLTREQGDQILAELKAIQAKLETGGVAAAAVQRPAVQVAPATATLPDAQGHASLGSASAPVTIVEFTDLQCPYCARFASQTLPELKRQYIATGKVRFVSRDLPLPMHAQAKAAAVAARCAGRQGKYWEYREALFAAQSELGNDPFDRLATQAGLDPSKFAACRANPGTLPTDVQYDAALAGSIGINGTPSFVIGRTTEGTFTGEKISGAQPFEVFDERIKALLAK